MRQWQVGDPIGDGNDIGVLDVAYMDYLKKREAKAGRQRPANIDKSSIFQNEALKLKDEGKYYDALAFINSAIGYAPEDAGNWNVRGLILWNIFLKHGEDVSFDAIESFDVAIGLEPDNRIIKNNKAKFLSAWAIDLYKSGDVEFADIKIDEAFHCF